ncbi:glycosyltransferase family 8 protein [Gorillibacterium sp. CAU 1737]|uniref:glycosyltransferase family 8 protein n=1 Tax=Gorillibacterium sp. CAU 1737 TaxID=3140362 RepID=UPI00326053EC
MNILVSSSKLFFPYLSVMLASLYESHNYGELCVYLLHKELDTTDLNILQSQATSSGNRVIPIQIDEKELYSLPTRMQWPLVLYYRLSLVEVLPESVDRILSLDVDLVVRKPLNSLYESNLEGVYVAACEDLNFNTRRYKQGIGLPNDCSYFNAGVMLFHVSKLREDNIRLKRFLDEAEQLTGHLTFLDQDLLNVVFREKVRLERAEYYNCSPALYDNKSGSIAAQHPNYASIIHYLGHDQKPWDTFIGEPGSELQEIWWNYARQTSFYPKIKEDFDKKYLKILANQNIVLKKYYGVAIKWLSIEDRVYKLEQYFLQRNVQRVAGYGINLLQSIFVSDLQKSKIQLAYLIDSYATGYAYGLEIKRGTQYTDIDAIIVVAFPHYSEICEGIEASCDVLSLEEIIEEIYRW